MGARRQVRGAVWERLINVAEYSHGSELCHRSATAFADPPAGVDSPAKEGSISRRHQARDRRRSTQQTSASTQEIAASAQQLASSAGRLEEPVATFKLS
jgi:hypothetical protein